MTIGTLHVAGRKFRVIPEDEFQTLRRQAKVGRAMAKPRADKPRRPRTLKQMTAAMTDHWDEIVAKAKRNTKRLTGREVL